MYLQEKRQEEEEVEAKLAAQEAAHAKTASDLSNEVCREFLDHLKKKLKLKTLAK